MRPSQVVYVYLFTYSWEPVDDDGLKIILLSLRICTNLRGHHVA